MGPPYPDRQREADDLVVKPAVQKHAEQGEPRASPPRQWEKNHFPRHPRNDSVPTLSPEFAERCRGDRAIKHLLDGESHLPKNERPEIKSREEGQKAETDQGDPESNPTRSRGGKQTGHDPKQSRPGQAVHQEPGPRRNRSPANGFLPSKKFAGAAFRATRSNPATSERSFRTRPLAVGKAETPTSNSPGARRIVRH